jgi:hypothetical protein
MGGSTGVMTPQSWIRYTPNKRSPWTLRRVVHLHRRAGFAANWEEIQRDLKEGHEASIDRVFRRGRRQ